MTRMRDVIRGVEKDVFDKAFDAFNKDAQIAKGEFHISGIVATGDVSRQFILEGLELRRETKDRIIRDEDTGKSYTVGPSTFPNGLVRRQIGPTETFPAICSPARAAMFAGTAFSKLIGGATHVIESSLKVVAQGSMDKLENDFLSVGKPKVIVDKEQPSRG